MSEFRVVDLGSQTQAVARHVIGWSRERFLQWLSDYGVVLRVPDPGRLERYAFRSHSGRWSAFWFSADDVLHIPEAVGNEYRRLISVPLYLGHEGDVMDQSGDWHDPPAQCRAAWKATYEGLYTQGYAPLACPCCARATVRVYWRAHGEHVDGSGQQCRKGGGWLWCPECHVAEHWSGFVPAWWPRRDPLPEVTLYGDPETLDERWADLERALNERTDGSAT